MSFGKERKFLASKPSLPSSHYNLEDAWKQYGDDFESPEEFIETVATEIKICNDDILHFAQNYFYVISVDRGREVIELYDCQKTIIQNLVDYRFNSIVASRQIGKALDVDTPIPTPNGFIRMGDLKEGDYVFGTDGNPTKVLNAWEVLNDRKCYEVVFDNGESIIADENHNWFTQSRTERSKKLDGSVKTTKEILNNLTCGKKIEPNHRIPIAKSTQYSEKKLKLSPYILGIWLGDGSHNASRIHCGPSDYDELKSLIQSEGINVSENANDKKRYVSMIGNTTTDTNRPLSVLRELGVYGNKHIPDEYLISSVSQRIDLLCGLMDTDGYVNKSGTCQFYSSNFRLHEQVKVLLSSLGVKWSASSKFPKIGDKVYDEHFILTFKPEFECFKYKRKKERQHLTISNVRGNFLYIKEINEVESRPVRCITVEAENHLFLCGKSHIPTSNTTIVTIYALWQACFNKDQNIFVLANKEDTAKMILERIRLAYEEIPNWLKPTVVEFSKTSIKFDNGSKISTSTTSEQGIRGQAANCVDGSSMVTIRDKNNGNIFDISMEELSNILETEGDMLSIKIESE